MKRFKQIIFIVVFTSLVVSQIFLRISQIELDQSQGHLNERLDNCKCISSND